MNAALAPIIIMKSKPRRSRHYVGADRSRRSNLMYCEYRKMLLSGEKLRAEA